jgi:hypothetical protein
VSDWWTLDDFVEMIFHGRFFEYSPVPKCEGPGAPSMWLEQNPETGAPAKGRGK